MRNTLITKLLSLALCASMFGAVTAYAEVGSTGVTKAMPAPLEETIAPIVDTPVAVFGTVSIDEEGNYILKNESGISSEEIMVMISEETAIIDNVTGFALNKEEIKDGDNLHIWLSQAMTMSIPPQSHAVAIVANVAEDAAAPIYYQVIGIDQTPVPLVEPAVETTEVNLPVSDGTVLNISKEAQLSPYKTRNIITWADLIPGTNILTWADAEGKIERVLAFPYSYNGYLETAGDIITVSSELIDAVAKTFDEKLYLPLRAVSENAGFEVDWTREKGAIILAGGVEIMSVLADAETATTPDGEYILNARCVLDNDTTYILAEDLAYILNMFYIA